MKIGFRWSSNSTLDYAGSGKLSFGWLPNCLNCLKVIGKTWQGKHPPPSQGPTIHCQPLPA